MSFSDPNAEFGLPGAGIRSYLDSSKARLPLACVDTNQTVALIFGRDPLIRFYLSETAPPPVSLPSVLARREGERPRCCPIRRTARGWSSSRRTRMRPFPGGDQSGELHTRRHGEQRSRRSREVQLGRSAPSAGTTHRRTETTENGTLRFVDLPLPRRFGRPFLVYSDACRVRMVESYDYVEGPDFADPIPVPPEFEPRMDRYADLPLPPLAPSALSLVGSNWPELNPVDSWGLIGGRARLPHKIRFGLYGDVGGIHYRIVTEQVELLHVVAPRLEAVPPPTTR